MLNGLDLFSGIGGLSLALQPWVTPVAYCEIDPYCRGVLLSRMRANVIGRAPIWDDVTTLDGGGLPRIDIVYGGFPCQPFSTAARGRNNAPNLWPSMLRLIREIKPRYVFAENVTREAIDTAANHLWGLGYVARCTELSASAALGAPAERRRFWLLADAHGDSQLRGAVNAKVAGISPPFAVGWWERHRPELLGVDDGVPARVDRLRALGNAVVPAQAREAFCRLMWGW